MRGFDWDSKILMYKSSEYVSGGDRRTGFEKYLRYYAESYPEVDTYYRRGSWRDVPADDPAGSEHHVNASDNQCYYNAQTGLAPGLTYYEGYVVSDNVAIAHAWLEDDSCIIETSPALLQMDIDYFGMPFEDSTVRSVMADRETAEPIVEAVVP